MALDINGYNDTFKAFVDFAQAKKAANDKTAVAHGSLGEDGALAGREIKAASTDWVHKRSRTDADVAANDRTRAIFKNAIIDMFGGESKIPAKVKKAMLMADYNCGKPLTARRILAVKAAIDANGIMREKKAASDTIGAFIAAEYEVENTAEERSKAVDSLLRGVGKDRDLLTLLQFNNCGVLRGIMFGSGEKIRAGGEVAERLEALRRNVDELRAASRGDKRMFNAGLRQLSLFGGKALRDGMVASMCALARKVNLKALRNISAEAAPSKILAAMCVLHKGAFDVRKNSGVLRQFNDPGGDDVAAVNAFAMAIMFSRCDNKTLRGLRAGLCSENCGKVLAVAEGIGKNTKDDNIKTGALTFRGLFYRTSIWGLDDILGDKASHLPELNAHYDITKGEYDACKRMIEAHAAQVAV